MEFSRQEYWSGLLFSSPGIFPTQALNPGLWHCRQILYHSLPEPLGKPTLSGGGSLLLLTLTEFCSFIINFASSGLFQSVQGFHTPLPIPEVSMWKIARMASDEVCFMKAVIQLL